jgi:DNA end-binding protein Ku
MTVDFDPSQYRDGYREALEELVAAKMQGHEVIRPQQRPDEGGGSLADALRASLAATKDPGGGNGSSGRRPGAGGAAGGARKRAASTGTDGRKRPPGGKASA